MSSASPPATTKSGWFFAQRGSSQTPSPQKMSQIPERSSLTPQFCFSSGTLRGSSSIDDSISQNLNALLTPSQKGFDPDSTPRRTTARSIGRPACRSYCESVLFPAWQARTEVLDYCALVATSPDPDDPEAAIRDVEKQKDRERVVDERLDPYSGRFFPREARTQALAMLIRQERDVERIVRTQTWNVVRQRCTAVGEDFEDAVNRWRASGNDRRSQPT
ncbi:hypothetical protein L249_5917 [Ophiocordyceps polyrhachis-furcata BCC 54312]|uniref:Caffeine-induced death protein Cid2 n=1 Tax=Ophiocordyceps polyrhachis-furcata BCC 54312 TaxID=1330021 RepID=A0A367LIC0_9HYPO|nr:hypothetical protein L249_5917 [Ophiocordyceps polyrhachis-furcata BCC 54312]